MMKGGAIRGTSVGSAVAFRDVIDFIAVHSIKPSVTRTYPINQARQDYDAADSGKPIGKFIIQVSL